MTGNFIEISEELYQQLSLDIAAAIGLASVHAPDLRDRLLKSSTKLDDAFYEFEGETDE